MKKSYKTEPIKRPARMWLIIFAFLIIIMWLVTWRPIADVVAPALNMEPGQLQDTAWNVIIMTVGAVLLLLALGAIASVPLVGVLLGIAGAALVISGAWSLFKYWENGTTKVER